MSYHSMNVSPLAVTKVDCQFHVSQPGMDDCQTGLRAGAFWWHFVPTLYKTLSIFAMLAITSQTVESTTYFFKCFQARPQLTSCTLTMKYWKVSPLASTSWWGMLAGIWMMSPFLSLVSLPSWIESPRTSPGAVVALFTI